jgi:hypothetical protein
MRKPAQTKEEILNILKSHIEEIRGFGVTRIGLFGSFARDQQKEESDVDILVEFLSGKKTFRNFVQLVYLLEELLHRQVELVTTESLSPYLKPYIFNEVKYVETESRVSETHT